MTEDRSHHEQVIRDLGVLNDAFKPFCSTGSGHRDQSELQKLAVHGITTYGTEGEYLAAFPTILSMAAMKQAGGFFGFEPTTMIGKLKMCSGILTDNHWRSVWRVFVQVFYWRLSEHPKWSDSEIWLQALVENPAKLEMALQHWERRGDLSAKLHFLDLVLILMQYGDDIILGIAERFSFSDHYTCHRLLRWVVDVNVYANLLAFEPDVVDFPDWHRQQQRRASQWLAGLSSQ